MKRAYGFFMLVLFSSTLLALSVPAREAPFQIYAPPTPSSIPLLLAAQNLDNLEVTIFSNHSQAHTLFLRGDIPLLMTGLSVGINFFKNQVPAQIITSYVSGLTYLVTRDKQMESFRELQGEELYLPFEGSPIEEMTKFFMTREGLVWKEDVAVVYAPFPSSLELLKQGKASAVVLPEPFATLAAARDDVFLSLRYKTQWDRLTGGTGGYPQLGLFVKQDWAAAHPDVIAAINRELDAAIRQIQTQPEQAIAATKDAFKFPEAILLNSLRRTDFTLLTSDDMRQAITRYYEELGTPLDETFNAFFYLDPQ